MSTISDFTPQNNSANDPGLTLRGADGPRPINPAALRDVEYRSQIRQWCHAATSPLVCVISGLLDWADVDRWLVLELVASVPGAQVRIAEDASDSSDLFEASISLMVDASDVARCGRGRRAAIEAAALVVDSIAREIRELVGSLRAIASAGESGHQRVCDVLDCTLVPEAMVVPAGWQLDAAGVSRVVDGKSTQVISTPVVISRRFQNLDHTGRRYSRNHWTGGRGPAGHGDKRWAVD